MYADDEIREIRDMLSGKTVLTEEQAAPIIDRLQIIFSEKPHLGPFGGFLATNPDLFEKIERDGRVKDFFGFGFFPKAFPLVYGSETSPQISFDRGNRGTVVLFRHPEGNFVIKPYQSSREAVIAQEAASLGVGPKQFESLDLFLTEELLEGTLLTFLPPALRITSNVEKIGRDFGQVLSRLHERGIYYNDTTVSDDMRRSHIMVGPQGRVTLFDYGVALTLENHPNFTDEEVFDFARTLPQVNMRLQFQRDSPELRARIVEEYRPILEATDPEDIIGRDFDFVTEGLSFLAYNFGNPLTKAFGRGFQQGYMS